MPYDFFSLATDDQGLCNQKSTSTICIVLGPVTPLQILPEIGPDDDLYTIQEQQFRFCCLIDFHRKTNKTAQLAQPGFSGRAGWAELVGEIELAYLAATLDLDSVWYRDHLFPF